MRDLHVNIGGPRNNARQNVSFQIAPGERPAVDAQQITQLVSQLREALEQSRLPPEELRRVERRLTAIEEEASSEQPALTEINEGLSFLGQLVQTAQGLTPLFSSTYQLLAAALAPLAR